MGIQPQRVCDRRVEVMSKRPKYHFTPKRGWMNDPNGPVYFRGEYHLFFQHDPNALSWGLMHWGHAKSKDLRTWEELPIALYPDEQGAVFSGSAFVDTENVSGFGTFDEPALLLFYTSHNMQTGREMQCLAYSTDGRNFTKYKNNPVIPGTEGTPARDPQIFRNRILGGYSLCLTTEKCVEFYHSVDFLHWDKTGEFTLPSFALQGMIECPCLIFDTKDCLMLSMEIPESEFGKLPKEAVPHTRLMQYFIGDFNGRTFVADPKNSEVLPVDCGEDFYAGTVFANTDENILIAWLGDFSEGARNAGTKEEGFQGVLSYPRLLKIKETPGGYRLWQAFYPVPLPDGVDYNETSDGAEFTDGCVKEIIKDNGFLTITSYQTCYNKNVVGGGTK